MTNSEDDASPIVVGVFGAIVVGLLLIIGASLWANLSWAPHAAEIALGQQKIQLSCIDQHGIWDGYRCYWSGGDLKP